MKNNLETKASDDRKTVLLVDDHTLFREGLKGLLKKDPIFEVCGEAGTVGEACKRAAEIKPDIVLMDIALPDNNGIEATRHIKQMLPATKIVMISMYSNMDYIINAVRAGAAGYLVKDTTPDMLLSALTTVMQGHYYFDNTITDEIAKFISEQQFEESAISEENYDRLTRREQEIMRLVAQGLSTKHIAGKLCISPKTVENHRTKIMEKLHLDNVVDLVKYAAKLGVIDLRSWED